MNKANLNCVDTVIERNIKNTTRQSRTATSLTRLSRYARNDDFNCKSIIFNFQSSIFNFSKSAFSLIELSIVLIIIGLLIAGVTGGASLIQSAKVRSMINELKEYERAVYTFQAAKGRFPGDVKNYGTFGTLSNYYKPTEAAVGLAKPGYKYQASDFPSSFITEFRTTAGADAIPDAYSAPYAELYNEGIIDFKPLGNAYLADRNEPKKGTPNLKSEPGAYMYFEYTGSHPDYAGTPCQKDVKCLYESGLVHDGQIREVMVFVYGDNSASKGFNPKILKGVDEKLDDGSFNVGAVRGRCYGSEERGYNTYDNAIESGKKCGHFYYAI